MSQRPPFDLAHTPIEPGTTLIEASAGTGKTFTIAGLFLRLVLERNYSVREILVVTFTEAATEELRGRIRERLVEAAAVLAANGQTSDEVLRALVAPHLERRDEMLIRLDRAICSFDETPIFTIHGFCQRMLRDRAFESRALFDVELLKDDSRILQEIADDFWRKHFYETDAISVHVLLRQKYQPENFLRLLRIRNRHPTMKVISPVDGQKPGALLQSLTGAFEAARTLWRNKEPDIRAAFGDSSVWAKGDHAKSAIVDSQWQALADCFEDQRRTPESMEAMEFFAASKLSDSTKARKETPEHDFFDRCEEFCEQQQRYLIGLDLEFLDYATEELPRRKQRLKLQSFDDLLTGLHAALQAAGGERLAREIRARYRAALIDEFQDTDPVQYGIFRELFQRRDHLLFLIGDPKQAIYGFRGADIFTYLDAARIVDRGYTLGRNFRSESGLVHAVNTFFTGADRPFLFEEIRFQPVEPGGRADAARLTEQGASKPPLHLWFVPRDSGGNDITKGTAEKLILQKVAGEIARLLNTPCRLGDARVTPRDIAVLVPENRHARLMQETLRQWRIPSVLYTEESVFSSREARELQRVLAAIAVPSNESLLRSALSTELMGVNGGELDALSRNEAASQAHLDRTLLLHDIWQAEGFTPMFRQWLQLAGVRPRLLHFDDGERRLTNLLHLGEVLHQAVLDRRLGPAGLARWLSEQIASEERDAEEHQLRLERDDHAVKLVTIHKSKGLEYPIVFCPFSWKSSETRSGPREPVFFHQRNAEPSPPEPAGSTSFICDLGSAQIDEHRQLAFQERLAENLRLLYVTLTRARNRCYFVWGAFNKAETSAAAWLLHPSAATNTSLSDTMKARLSELSDESMKAELLELAERSRHGGGDPTILIESIPDGTGKPYEAPVSETTDLSARIFDGRIRRDWRILSFSALAARSHTEAPDYDPLPAIDRKETPEPDAATGIFAFPRGSKPGACLHKIFEELDFASNDRNALLESVTENLSAHGLSPTDHAETVCETVLKTLAVPLAPGRPDFTLKAVPSAERLVELEFFFPIEGLDSAALGRALAALSIQPSPVMAWESLGFRRAGGFMKGFIDLVFRFDGRFYIVDWKSNHLGNRVEDYSAATLAREMTARCYTLQYMLYTVAVHRYLQLRLPDYDYEKHFGGVLYLFLRGLDPAQPDLGVFRDRPPAETIAQLSRLMGAQP